MRKAAGSGNLLSTEQWLDGGTNPQITMTYDGYGNPVTHTDARGNTTITDYDALTHTYPARITFPQTNGISHIIEHPDYDYRWGKVKTIIIGDVVDKVNFSMLWSW